MYKFVYKNLKTGAKVLSHTPQSNKNLELISEIRTTDIKRKEIEDGDLIKKTKKTKKK